MVFCVHVAVGAGAGYSIELGVGALSGLSEIMILANLMSRLMHLAKKKTAAKPQRLQGPCRVSLKLCETSGSTPDFGNVEVQVHRFGSACLNRLLTYLRISLNGISKYTISHSCHYACVACMGLENMHKQDSEGAEVFRPFSQKIGHGFASCASAASLCNLEAKKKRFFIG